VKFTKWHGLGNDFILVDGRPDRWPTGRLADLARRVCDRHFGVGGDGLIFIFKDDQGTVSMRILNADGTEAEMCGNGLRCVAKYAYLNGLVDRLIFDVNTGAGVLVPEVIVDGNRVVGGRVKEQRGTWLHRIEMQPFLTLRYLAEAVASERHVNFANVASL